ncbi:BON domain-containing protein [Roseomonas sp. JC162]|uniref:BON domain-containing protein n=1 Tax=Neoroseomonas marina TaxID=1232220 RepID=A0A848EHG4_9PROT|nr:BON domain-containing protein [Neoroseomonas marina]NMJ42828.1 BON domain-containing protein [Neoroseomonas marina]
MPQRGRYEDHESGRAYRYGRDRDDAGRDRQDYGRSYYGGGGDRYGVDRPDGDTFGRRSRDDRPDYGRSDDDRYPSPEADFARSDWARRDKPGRERDEYRDEDWPSALTQDRIGVGQQDPFSAGQAEGPHRGKGPRGYSRNDEQIREDVCSRLADDSNLDATDIEVEVKDGEVTLAGNVRERGDKRRAEDIADAASGVKHVQNNLRLKPAGSGGEEDGSEKTSGTTQMRAGKRT